LGVRAFGTQLLCEQVVGRALRRQNYSLNPESARFDVEYADILGIPFDFTSQAVPAPVKPPPQTIQVKAISPERDGQEIRFPQVIGYRVELPDEQVKASFNDDHILELTPEDNAWMFQTNVLAALRVTQGIARGMVQNKRGHIVFMSSIAAREVYRLASVYCATKHALSALARSFRIELQAHGIKVTEVAPGMVDTDIRTGSNHPDVLASVATRKFKALTADEVAQAVVYALSAQPNCCPDLIELRPQGSA
jgi:hypothetical protein